MGMPPLLVVLLTQYLFSLQCSAESTEGFCANIGDTAWDCKAENICRTCSTFTANGGMCVEIDHYPNATVTEFGPVSGADAMAKEIFARGPIACDVDATMLDNYTGATENRTLCLLSKIQL